MMAMNSGLRFEFPVNARQLESWLAFWRQSHKVEEVTRDGVTTYKVADKRYNYGVIAELFRERKPSLRLIYVRPMDAMRESKECEYDFTQA